VLIELPLEVLCCFYVVVVVSVGREETELALPAGSEDWDFIHPLQDHEAALGIVHWLLMNKFSSMSGAPARMNSLHLYFVVLERDNKNHATNITRTKPAAQKNPCPCRKRSKCRKRTTVRVAMREV
jgi:hypothetical protein